MEMWWNVCVLSRYCIYIYIMFHDVLYILISIWFSMYTKREYLMIHRINNQKIYSVCTLFIRYRPGIEKCGTEIYQLRSQERRWHLRPRLRAKVRARVGASLQRHWQGAFEICCKRWKTMVMEWIYERKFIQSPSMKSYEHSMIKASWICWASIFNLRGYISQKKQRYGCLLLAAGGQFYS